MASLLAGRRPVLAKLEPKKKFEPDFDYKFYQIQRDIGTKTVSDTMLHIPPELQVQIDTKRFAIYLHECNYVPSDAHKSWFDTRRKSFDNAQQMDMCAAHYSHYINKVGKTPTVEMHRKMLSVIETNNFPTGYIWTAIKADEHTPESVIPLLTEICELFPRFTPKAWPVQCLLSNVQLKNDNALLPLLEKLAELFPTFNFDDSSTIFSVFERMRRIPLAIVQFFIDKGHNPFDRCHIGYDEESIWETPEPEGLIGHACARDAQDVIDFLLEHELFTSKQEEYKAWILDTLLEHWNQWDDRYYGMPENIIEQVYFDKFGDDVFPLFRNLRRFLNY